MRCWSAVNIYWYWPFPHRGENALALGLLRPDDHLTVHSLASRFGEQLTGTSVRYDIRRELPEPRPRSRGSVRWLGSRALTYSERAGRRLRAVRGGGFDICHIHSLNYFTDGIALAPLHRHAAVVSSVNDVVPHERRIPHAVENRLLSVLYRQAGHLVVYHERLRTQLHDEFGVGRDRISVVPHPVLSAQPPADGSVTNGAPTVLFFGTFRRNKGIRVLLDAIRRLDGLAEVRFVFAGRGDADLERAVREAAASDRRIEADIRYIENDERAKLYRRADLVVLPYTAFASQSGVLADAYAYHAPILATDVGAVGDTVRDDGTGWVIDPGDPEALAAGIQRALADDEGRRAARSSAAAAAERQSYPAVAARLRAIYRSVLDLPKETGK